MFLSKTHAPQLLQPQHYASAENYAIETERILRPAWHFIATTADIPNPGDYLTDELLGQPLLIRNCDGTPQVFLNVCSHRFCALSSKPKGHDPKFSCQYHGWEYDASGNTRRIPDAPSFRPLEKGTLGLTKFRTECCGPLIFVSLLENGPSLRDSLDGHYDRLEALLQGAVQTLSMDFPAPANWKIPTENSLESYHIDSVHTSTFKHMPPESDCRHELHSGSTVFYGPGGPFGWQGVLHRALARQMKIPTTQVYTHTHIFPSFTFFHYDLVVSIQHYMPCSPTTSRFVWRFFVQQSESRFWNAVARSQMPLHSSFIRTVHDEDARMYASIQAGLSAPRHPTGGLLSVREERLRHFEEWVHRRCYAGDTTPSDPLREASRAATAPEAQPA